MSEAYQQLVKDRIFIGGAADAKTAVANEGIDVVFDLRAEAGDSEESYTRVHAPIVDDSTEQQDESIQEAVDGVVTAYEEGKKVFFHCAGGSNRAGSVAIGTLLALGEAKTVEEAEQMAKNIRPIISVKPELKESLQRLFPNA
ncbi:protein-tyrosine phosphatase family protein [Planococcus maritimus]|uniref:protein-tyrosine phosphatase family protein n=1 Tax=Planococcus maritimus TaxID=192421 RepID=UPI00079659FA|nr:dual specificity protein phosphatase family protein [Planococcus maritimus]KYG59268.1 protein tyrosine phosphatase [Planococcus maritimus]OED32972.1 protein tyrosine phosphatase [Planococcus maritimus]